MNIQDDIKARWNDFTTGKINAMELMYEYIYTNNNHLAVEEIHNEYVKLKAERERIEQEVIDKIKGVFVLESEYSYEVDSNVVLVPAVLYTYSTKTALLASITSELWSVTDVVAEMQGKLLWTDYIKTL